MITKNCIAIVTINLNNAEGLRKTIASLERVPDFIFHWIFVDGHSRDDSCAIARASKISNKLVFSERDSGIYDAMNKGISLLSAATTHVWFLNSGDELDIGSRGIDAKIEATSGADVLLFGAHERWRLGLRRKAPRLPLYLYYGMPTHHQSVIYRSSVLRDYKFDTCYRLAGDYEHLCRLYRANKRLVTVDASISIFSNDGLSRTLAANSRIEAAAARVKSLGAPRILNWLIVKVQTVIHMLKINLGYFAK